MPCCFVQIFCSCPQPPSLDTRTFASTPLLADQNANTHTHSGKRLQRRQQGAQPQLWPASRSCSLLWTPRRRWRWRKKEVSTAVSTVSTRVCRAAPSEWRKGSSCRKALLSCACVVKGGRALLLSSTLSVLLSSTLLSCRPARLRGGTPSRGALALASLPLSTSALPIFSSVCVRLPVSLSVCPATMRVLCVHVCVR